MKPTNHGENQGEGDKASARNYNRKVREFVAEGKVDEAARAAAHYLERDPADAERAERAARKGPKHPVVSVDQLVAKGKTVVDRVRPVVERIVEGVRARLRRKSPQP